MSTNLLCFGDPSHDRRILHALLTRVSSSEIHPLREDDYQDFEDFGMFYVGMVSPEEDVVGLYLQYLHECPLRHSWYVVGDGIPPFFHAVTAGSESDKFGNTSDDITVLGRFL